MDVVEYLLEQRRSSYEILKKNGIKQQVVTGHCPQCQQTKQEIEYEQQFIDPTVPEKIPVPQKPQPEEVIHIYTDDESEVESLMESEVESENIQQQTQNQSLPLFL